MSTATGADIYVVISVDGGSNYSTNYLFDTDDFLQTDQDEDINDDNFSVVGGSSDLWGLSSVSDVDSFRIGLAPSGSTPEDWLRDWYGFSFDIPSGAIINGIEARAEGRYLTDAFVEEVDSIQVRVDYTVPVPPEPNKNTTKEFVHAFTEDTLSSEPAGLTKVGTNNAYAVSNDRAWYGLGTGAYSMSATGGGSIEHNWAYFPTNRSDGDGYHFGVFNFDNWAGDRAGLVFRAHDDSGTEKCYAAFMYGGDSLRLAHFSGTTESVITTQATESYDLDTWYGIRVYTSGSTIKARVWKITDEEPSTWDIDTTDATIDNTATGIGVYGRMGSGNPVYCDHLHSLKYDALPNGSPSTLAEERENVWTSMKDRFLRWDGAVIKADSGGMECVSEGIGYFMLEAVNQNDQTSFDLIFNFALDQLAGNNNAESWDYLFAWHFDIDGGNSVSDWNYASDADNDILYAVIAAHNKWGSAGDIDYESYITLIGADLYTYTINTEGTLHLQVPYPSELAIAVPEINPSYFRPALFELLIDYDSSRSSQWTQVLADGWSMIDRHTDNAGNLATSAGLVADWISYDTVNDDMEAPTDGGHTTNHSFEVVRVYPFFELAASVYNSSDASDYMTGNIATFFNDEYTDHSKIKADYNHDGTDATGNDYNLSYFNWGYAFVLDRASASNASAFRTNFVDQYTTNTTDATIAYFGSDGYYGGSLNMINASVDDGAFADLSVESEVSTTNGLFFGAGP